jgi:hypothetical protein
MAKGQQRSKKEIKKPKQDKTLIAPAKSFIAMPKTTVPAKQK